MSGKGQGQTQMRTKQQKVEKCKKEERPSKRTHSELSNDSVGEAAAIHVQLDEMTEELTHIREDIKLVLKKEDIETLITQTVKDIMKSLETKLKEDVRREVDEKCRSLKEEVETLTFEKKQLEGELQGMRESLEKRIGELEESSREHYTRGREAIKMANYNEQYSRKNNVKIRGVPEDRNETQEKLTDRVCAILSEQGIEMERTEILALHRIPANRGGSKPVLLKTISNSVKSKIMRKRQEMKHAGHQIVDDVTRLNTGLISRLSNHGDIKSAWFFNGSVFGLTKNSERIKFDLYDNIGQVIHDYREKQSKNKSK